MLYKECTKKLLNITKNTQKKGERRGKMSDAAMKNEKGEVLFEKNVNHIE